MRLGLKTRQMSAESHLFLSLILKRGKGIQLHSGSGHHFVLLLLLFLFYFHVCNKGSKFGNKLPLWVCTVAVKKNGERGVICFILSLFCTIAVKKK
jgi:hypothetical protein